MPSHPKKYYQDFPGFDVFYGRETKYRNWQQAAKAVQVLGGARNRRVYAKIRHKDPRLPGSPNTCYKDFPGWIDFLKKESKYPTWQEAAAAIKKLGVTDYEVGYTKACKKDQRLPKSLAAYYPNYPGWSVFLGGVSKYETWQEASKATQALGIKTYPDYRKRYIDDPRLHRYPDRFYKDFPGWTKFCTGSAPKKFYPTWQQASRAARKLGLTTQPLYKDGYKQDSRLPGNPNITYKDHWPGFTKFFGVVVQYATCKDAMKAAKKFKFTGKEDYIARRKVCDPRLHVDPRKKYPDFPGWPKYLGKE